MNQSPSALWVSYTFKFLCFELLPCTGFNTQTFPLIHPKTMLYPSIFFHRDTIKNKKGLNHCSEVLGSHYRFAVSISHTRILLITDLLQENRIQPSSLLWACSITKAERGSGRCVLCVLGWISVKDS